MHTIVETRRYISRAEKLLTMAERDMMLTMVAAHPLKDDLIEGTGGIRKLRFGRGAKGKSGGVRAIYYYYNQHIPIFMLDLFGKNEKANLSKSERNALAALVVEIKRAVRETSYE